MASLRFWLLGAPYTERNGQRIHIERRLTMALAIYLAVTQNVHSRDALAAFFWPQADRSSGRANLRRIVHTLSAKFGKEFVIVEDDEIGIQTGGDVWLDLWEFRRLLATCRDQERTTADRACLRLLVEATDLYRGEFLSGFTLTGSPDFDQWQLFETEQLRAEINLALDLLIRGYTERSEFLQAIVYAQRRLALEPTHEPTHRQLMQLYASTEQYDAVQRQYELCARLLADELSSPPADETNMLYNKIHQQFRALH